MKSFRWGIGALGVAVAAIVVAGALGFGIAAQAQNPDGNPLHNRYLEILAGKLGISVDQLKADQQDAWNQTVDEAKSNGTITDQQAERLQNLPGDFSNFGRGFKRLGGTLQGIVGTVASDIGVDPKDLLSELKSGKSLATIAQEHDVNRQALIDDITQSVEAKLQSAVDAGTITADQKQKVMDALSANIGAAIDWTPGSGQGLFGGAMSGFRFGHHGMHSEEAAP